MLNRHTVLNAKTSFSGLNQYWTDVIIAWLRKNVK